MHLLPLKPLFLKTKSNLLSKWFEKLSQKITFSVSFDIALLSKINKGMVVSAKKCDFLLSNITKKNRKITSTKFIYSL